MEIQAVQEESARADYDDYLLKIPFSLRNHEE